MMMPYFALCYAACMAKRKKPEPDLAPELGPAPLELADKRASEPETIRWVARNISVEFPDASDCPDPFAWTLLSMCREEPGFRVFFVEKLWTKLIPSRANLDEADNVGPMDGQATVDMIEKIQRMSVEARLPTPDPILSSEESVPDFFADYDYAKEDKY
jgi:hypothetical protein